MSASLFSPSWYRVAGLVPRLRSHARIHRMRYRGQRWYVLQDRATGAHHRFSPAAQVLIGLMDGSRTLGEIWRIAGDRLGDDLPTQDETIRLMSQLHQANALVTDAAPDASELAFRGSSLRSKRRRAALRSPLAIKIPLVDPDRALSAALPWVAPLFTRSGALLWGATVVGALVLAGQHWGPLTEGVADRVLAAENLVALWITFPVVKLLHELGHGFAVKRWGGEVHEMGIMLLVGVPVPYVDATASTSFPRRTQRAFVGAAGVVTELFVAALATFAWVAVEPGAFRSLCFNTMLIASVSSVVFNGNPLLRFDAYYVLSDWLEIPNLGQRANRYLGYWLQRHAFGRRAAESPAHDGREALWLAGYAVASFFGRLLVTLSIALYVASHLFAVGVLLAAVSLTQFALLPLWRQCRFLVADPRLRGRRGRALALTAGFAALVVLGIGFVPAPSWTRSEGVVWAPEGQQVRAGAAGEVASLLAEPGAVVAAGSPLFALRDPDLDHEVRAAEAALRALTARLAAERTRDRVQAGITREALVHARARVARGRDRRAELVVRSPRAGRFLVEAPGDWPGRFVRRGDLLGFVVEPDRTVVRVAVEADRIDLVRRATEAVAVRFSERVPEVYPARLVAEVPAATDRLPSPALSVEGGGAIALVSSGPEARAYRKHFLFDLAVDEAPEPVGVGGRVYVRFQHPPEPIAVQGARALRRLLLSQLHV